MIHIREVDWKHTPLKELAGLKAKAVTVNGTVIEGRLEYWNAKTHSGAAVESLSFVDVSQDLILGDMVHDNFTDKTISSITVSAEEVEK